MRARPGQFVHLNTRRAATRPTRLETAYVRKQPIPDAKTRQVRQQAAVIAYQAANNNSAIIAKSAK